MNFILINGTSENIIVIANHEERNGKQSYAMGFNVEIASVVPSSQ